nr:run domain Beclin-1-interacting and cysteine-rich domain-containing protein-like [Leptinotarsa decemlineata]
MNDSSHLFSKYQQLLRDLKSTVEGLLVTQVANVWSIYGGLNRLHNAVEKIFKHGCKGSGNERSYFNFIQGLEWLQPESAKSIFSLDCEYRPHVPAHFKDNKPSTWLYRSLENHSLSQKLSWLLSDKSHLSSCYQSYAYLCQEQFAEATIICLRAVERNQASLMSDISPYLFLQKTQEFRKLHRRCSSLPDSRLKKIYEEKSNIRRRPAQNVSAKGQAKEANIKGKLRPWLSMPSLQVPTFDVESRYHVKSKTTPSTPVHPKKVAKLSLYAFESDYITLGPKKNITPKTISTETHKLNHILIDNLDIVEHTATSSSSQSSDTLIEELISTKSMPASRSKTNLGFSPPKSVMDSFLPMPGEKDYTKLPKKTFIEDGGMSVLPMATGCFPKPMKGQSLLSFLTSGQFARANAELDRENAHFSISEAIISAMEQIRCKQSFKVVDEQIDESDPEIMDLKQRIRLRRTQRAIEKQRKNWVADFASESKTDTRL